MSTLTAGEMSRGKLLCGIKKRDFGVIQFQDLKMRFLWGFKSLWWGIPPPFQYAKIKKCLLLNKNHVGGGDKRKRKKIYKH